MTPIPLFPRLLLVCVAAVSVPGWAAITDDAYSLVSAARVSAGMTPLSADPLLAAAAAGHGQYLLLNNQLGHYQAAGLPGFTGVWPVDRAHAAGYRSNYVTENASAGEGDVADSVAGLLNAIYHRFGFLDFHIDEMGYGTAGSGGATRHVYNMGVVALEQACQGPEFSGVGTYYYGVCQPDIHIAAAVYEAAIASAAAQNPPLVVWPPDGANDVPPAFFEEYPDPLPDYQVSGSPVSIHFNPQSVTSVALQQLRLFRQTDNAQVLPTRLLDAATDPNAMMSDHQFALFPLKRLDWNTTYRAEAQYVMDGVPQTRVWHFHTRDLGVPVHTVTATGQKVHVTTGRPFALYIPPTQTHPRLESVSWTYPVGVKVDGVFEDQNTLRVSIIGQGQVVFSFAGPALSVTVESGPVPPDTLAPVVTVPADISLGADGANGTLATHPLIAAFLAGATAVDAVDGPIANVRHDAPIRFASGITTVTFSATDKAGNTGTAKAKVTVVGALDSDGDRMPDAWEDGNGLNSAVPDGGLDKDRDGASNLLEYLSGTDPEDNRDIPPFMLMPSRGGWRAILPP